MVIYSENTQFEDCWNKLNQSSQLPPFYSKCQQDFMHQRPKDNGIIVEDCSFVILNNNELVCGFRGSLMQTEHNIDLMAGEVACASIENTNILFKKIEREYIGELGKLLNKVNGIFWYQDYLINGNTSIATKYLMQSGASAKPIFTRVLNLNADIKELKSGLRKSYTSLVNWGIRELSIDVYNADNITINVLDTFRELHIREAGLSTRSLESWEKQLACIENHEAFIVSGSYNNEIVSMGYFTYSKQRCYYQISASRRDLFEKPLFHALMWTAIKYAKEINCSKFELGHQLFPNHPSDPLPTQKEQSISQFKAGFGGNNEIVLDIKMKC